MTPPLVSICLPNLNSLPYLRERIDTIRRQTHKNWELVISDNFSDDGAWEFFEEVAESEPRAKIAQAPRAGLYPNWNNCIARCQGDFIYIATSDDAMADDCVEKLLKALLANPDCELAHCPLKIVDVRGNEVEEPRWPDCTIFEQGLGQIASRAHVRHAPYDGLIHLTGQHVVLSITQLMMRRSLFQRVGHFQSRWGSVADFNWEMRAGLLASMVHVPDTWATWRIHPAQATASVDVYEPQRDQKFEEMIDDALEFCLPLLDPRIAEGLRSHWIELSFDMRQYYAGLRHRRSVAARRTYQVARFISGTKSARAQMLGRAFGKERWPTAAPAELRAWLESVVGHPAISEPRRASGSPQNADPCAGIPLDTLLRSQ